MGLGEVALTCVPGPWEMLAEALTLQSVCGGGHRHLGLSGWKSLIEGQEMNAIMSGHEQPSFREQQRWV